MQPVLVVSSPVDGMVCINGRMAGAVERGHTLCAPVSPECVLFVEFKPLGLGYLPLTLRIPFSKGVPVMPAPDVRVYAALWPGRVTELEMHPERMSAPPQLLWRRGGLVFSYVDAHAPLLRCDAAEGTFFHTLPCGALPPVPEALSGALLLRGEMREGGQYALILSEDGARAGARLEGKNISTSEDGMSVRVLRECGDTAGHAFWETWAQIEGSWQKVQAEPMWAGGMPHRPQTPEQTALAAVEAAQLGMRGDAASYFAPSALPDGLLERLASYDGCTALRFALPDGRDAVGVTRLEGGVLRVIPVYFRALPGGVSGAWQLEALEIDEVP